MSSLLVYNVVRVLQGTAPATVYSFAHGDDPQADAEALCATLNRLAADALCHYVIEEREGLFE